MKSVLMLVALLFFTCSAGAERMYSNDEFFGKREELRAQLAKMEKQLNRVRDAIARTSKAPSLSSRDAEIAEIDEYNQMASEARRILYSIGRDGMGVYFSGYEGDIEKKDLRLREYEAQIYRRDATE